MFEDSDSGADAPTISMTEQQLPITTYMVRNLPKTYSQDMLLEDWPPDGSFDFLYVPKKDGGNASLGYAFINFVSKEKACAFLSMWQGAAMPRHQTRKRIEFHPADVQGFEASVEHYKGKLKAAGLKTARLARPFIGRAGFDIDYTGTSD